MMRAFREPTGAAPMDTLLQRRRLTVILSLLLSISFAAVSLISYQASRSTIQVALVEKELPLTSNAIYAELQKDLIRPYFISSMMATNTFLHDWVASGEKDPDIVSRYLRETKLKYQVFTSFFVSEATRNYYYPDGILKKISASVPVDKWYFRVQQMPESYEINIDYDAANNNSLAIFMNFRVLDRTGKYLGATGVGLSMDRLHRLLGEYGGRYQKNIFLVDAQGRIRLTGSHPASQRSIQQVPGLRDIAAKVLQARNGTFQYRTADGITFLNVRYMPEVRLFLFVEGQEGEAVAKVRQALYLNLAICVVIVLLTIVLTDLTVRRFRKRLEVMATVDHLTGLMNRQAFELISERVMADSVQAGEPFAVVLADLDYFKQINDRFGHLAGDHLLREVGALLQAAERDADLLCRWGGEEFLLLLRHCDAAEAERVAEALRRRLLGHAFMLGGRRERITMSMGVATWRKGDSLQSMIDRADKALYVAKDTGRNRVNIAV
ncbi:diguanylate cyclase (GGDEF)-like protein [Fluviicoccus keumensis]|uniref:diguanylate cyclase n=1 Tax=Fluviicoccus keumensis TaxID=1435465 RepID=A0A4Q7ZD46_9GAMM|nr:sensor domain-containing diguanylate cyclase [Fluviicoccus keumensis]RZU47935.1 diguanylate cyclase (GGDEF)-like protein [Fluviicoccus keumensis]